MAISRWEAPDTQQAGPLDVLSWFDGPPVPDPITFIIGGDWLDKPNLYPRQATLIKIIFLRDDLFTDYDRQVIAEWQQRFAETNPDAQDNKFDARTKGLQPDLYERIAYLKARGYRWFPELIIAIGRRGAKGYLSALCMAYVLWNYLAKGNPQEYYGIDSNKPLACAVFAGKKEQAKENLWGDLYGVLTTAPCFTSYISEALAESLTIYAPYDFVRMRKLAQRGISSSKDQATFRVVPRESTPLAPRGPAGCILAFDEAAHVKNAGVTREFGAVYCLVPTTKVLCSDLTWKQLQDVEAGETLIGIDEHTETGKYRRLREAKILNKWATRGPALKITFDDGSHVTCSPTHRWLKVSSSVNYWCQTGLTPEQRRARGHHAHLKVGDRIRFLADPWEFDESREAGYLAGIYDGEGWISPASGRAIKAGFAQKTGVVLDRAVEALRERGFAPRVSDKARGNQVTDVYVCGQAEVLRLLGSVRPSRLMAKARRLWEDRAMANTTIDGGRISKTIASIEDVGDQDLIDIETSTGTFIAEGLVSHNSAAKPSLDQFGTDGFVVLPSSTWEMIGKFYELWELSLQREPDGEEGEYVPSYPDKFMVQLESWAVYEDWEMAELLPLFPVGFTGDLEEYDPEALPVLGRLKGAIQAYDESMAREEKANPDTFSVERRCIDLSMKVLTADLTWKLAGEVEVGDELIGFDEFAPEPTGPGRNPQRKLRTATVTKIWRTREHAYRITFADGSSVVCSAYHRWFSDGRWRSLYPAPGTPGPRQVMKVGDSIRWIVDPWEDDDSREAGYLAGMYDGEGTFLGRGRDRQEASLTVSQNPGLVLDETLRILKDKGFRPVKYVQDRKNEQWYITGLADCLRFVGQIRPVRFYPKRRQLWEGRAPHGVGDRSRTKTIVSIEKLPEQELVDIETTTHTFIAEGLISHNSDWATAMDAYLNAARIDAMFAPWLERPPEYGPPDLVMQTRGPLSVTYTCHGDPSSVNCRFGLAVAHTEQDAEGLEHAVFDLIHYWDPADFEDHTIDYDEIRDWIFDNVIVRFLPDEVTFDQFNSVASVQALQKKVRGQRLPKNIVVYERTATAALNWMTWETFKAALNMGFVHSPLHAEAKDELRFVQKRKGLAKIIPATTGPVQTKDIADCYTHLVEILTEHGWKLFKDVLDGERVATRNEHGELEYQHFTDRIERNYKGPVYQFKGERLNFSVTPKHRMLVRTASDPEWRFIHAEDLKPGQRYTIPKTTIVAGREPGIVDIDSNHLEMPVPVTGRGGSRKDGGWSEAEDAWLTGQYPVMGMDELLQGLPGRTRGSAYNRAKKLHLKRGQIGDRHGDRPKPLPPVSRELFAGFLGLWLADGRKYHHGSQRGYGVVISVKKRRKVSFLEDLLSRMDWPYNRTVTSKGEARFEVKSYGLREYLKTLCTGDHELHIPDEVFARWTADEMRALLSGLSVGDGSYSTSAGRYLRYCTSSRCLADDVQRLLLHTGVAGSVRQCGKAGDQTSFPGSLANHDRWYVSYDLKGGGTAGITGSQIEQVDYDGPVYCLTVPNGTLLVRREGVAMWAGNCIVITTARLLGEQMKAYLGKDLRNQRPHAAQPGGRDALDRFAPESMNPYASALGVPGGTHGGLARGMRPGLPGRLGRVPTGRGTAAAARRHRS